jgi:hypothetical protein
MIATINVKNDNDFKTLIRSDCIAALFIDDKEPNSVKIYLKGNSVAINLSLPKGHSQKIMKIWADYLASESST